jgi:hypothetical protein
MKESADVADGLKRAVVKNSDRWNAHSAMTYTVHCIAICNTPSDQSPPNTRLDNIPRCTSSSCEKTTACTPRIDPNTHARRATRPNPPSLSN